MHVSTLADPVQLQRMALLCGTKRPFQAPSVFTDNSGKEWGCIRIDGHLFALPSDRLVGLSFGALAERLFWLIHHEVRDRRVAEIVFSRDELRRRLWGAISNRNWLVKLRTVLKSLSKLRVGEWPANDPEPQLESSLPLFDKIEEVKESREFGFVVGEGFLGSLEQFAVHTDDGVRYDFLSKQKLRQLGKQQQVQDVYLPFYLGAPGALQTLSLASRQKRLLQAIIRELTFPQPTKNENTTSQKSLGSGELIRGDRVRGFGGKGRVECPDLDEEANHVGFNGNGVRRGQGYKLSTWQAKAGYNDPVTFLQDMDYLSDALGLFVGAVGKGGSWYALGRLRIMVGDSRRRHQVEKLHVRVYARADCFEQWNGLCGWEDAQQEGKATEAGTKERLVLLDSLREMMELEGLQQTKVAADLGVSKQTLHKALKKQRCSSELAKRIEGFLAQRVNRSTVNGHADVAMERPISPPNFIVRRPRIQAGSSAMKNAALGCHDRGWAVVPAEPGAKKPHVRWKKYQTEHPDREQIVEWWTKWPDANIAVVLGPVSDLLCVDVDGETPHRILLELCGEIPLAPTVKSGSCDPFRYHLYFRHPKGVETGASKTPWNKKGDTQKLELRGQGGILVLPPSKHKSGKRYAWVQDRSLRTVKLPELPSPLLEALVESDSLMDDQAVLGQSVEMQGLWVANSTADFLAGKYAAANGSRNNMLFRAACDMHGRGVPREKAEPLLIRGLQPKTFEEEREAGDTIASAFSEQRISGRF